MAARGSYRCSSPCSRSELSNHVDSIENSLENLQSILNTQTFTIDTSPLMEVSPPSGTSV